MDLETLFLDRDAPHANPADPPSRDALVASLGACNGRAIFLIVDALLVVRRNAQRGVEGSGCEEVGHHGGLTCL